MEVSMMSNQDLVSDASGSQATSKSMEISSEEVQVVETENPNPSANEFAPRQYFILTEAGKPVFTRRPDDSPGELASLIGVMQAIISVFLDDGDKIRHIMAGSTRITFLLRSPLYYCCVSNWREPDSVMRQHLEYLHLQVQSIISASQLQRIFEKRTNFDLGRLLSGAETFMNSLLGRLETDLAISTSSLHCLPMDSSLRSKLAECLVPTNKLKKHILYAMLVGRGKVITLVRPKKHSVHPADLHILLNTVHVPSIVGSPASWIPVCLPKYNPSSFLHVLVSFLRNEPILDNSPVSPSHDTGHATSQTLESSPLASDREHSNMQPSTGAKPNLGTQDAPIVLSQSDRQLTAEAAQEGRFGVGLVCASTSSDFDAVRAWCEDVGKKLEESQLLNELCQSIQSGATHYFVDSLGIHGVWHFIYKNRSHVQITHPAFEKPYEELRARKRLITLYQILHDNIHAKSGQESPLKLQYIRTDDEGVMGWITQHFELYIAVSPTLSKNMVVSAANAVVRWVKKEEANLFLRDVPTF